MFNFNLAQKLQLKMKQVLSRGFAAKTKKPMPCFKYFINKSTVLLQYREALQ